MKPLSIIAQDYLRLRRALGFKAIDTEYVLKWFLDFLHGENETHIKTDTVLCWIHSLDTVSLPQKSLRFAVIRKFAQYAHAIDVKHEVPAHRLVAHRTRRSNPYIYSPSEVLRLLEACRALPVRNGLCRYTYYTILGLLAVTGMRISEATSLSREDIDLSEGIITIRETKFSKTRRIPIHKTTVAALAGYIQRRDEVFPNSDPTALFLSDSGAALTPAVLRIMFVRLSHRIGLRKPSDHTGPRIHDFRHTFAVRAVMKWYRDGAHVESNMPVLSTYLGHAKPSDTYWYLSGVPELVGLAAARLQAHHRGTRR